MCEIFRDTPYFVDLKPGGKYVAKDMWLAGGVPMLLKTLYDGGFIHGDTVLFQRWFYYLNSEVLL